jgi:hypothetical protein
LPPTLRCTPVATHTRTSGRCWSAVCTTSRSTSSPCRAGRWAARSSRRRRGRCWGSATSAFAYSAVPSNARVLIARRSSSPDSRHTALSPTLHCDRSSCYRSQPRLHRRCTTPPSSASATRRTGTRSTSSAPSTTRGSRRSRASRPSTEAAAAEQGAGCAPGASPVRRNGLAVRVWVGARRCNNRPTCERSLASSALSNPP